jgi:hypothetical protein
MPFPLFAAKTRTQGDPFGQQSLPKALRRQHETSEVSLAPFGTLSDTKGPSIMPEMTPHGW